MAGKEKEIKKIVKAEWAVFAVLVILAAVFISIGKNDGKLHIYFLNVGQGDAIFIKTPANGQILIDGGPDDSVVRELGKVMPFYDRSIDMVILTHPDADHLNGLIEVLKRYRVGKIAETGILCETPSCQAWQRQKDEERAEVILAYLGNKIISDDGIVFEILHPFENIEGKKVSQKNNTSLILKLIYGGHSLLLTGDIEKIVENKIVLSRIDINSDFLKIPHHGSKTSTTEDFLRAASPLTAFINVGAKNRYGHPAKEVIERLENFLIPYYRTDINGRIEITLDGRDYQIKSKYLNSK